MQTKLFLIVLKTIKCGRQHTGRKSNLHNKGIWRSSSSSLHASHKQIIWIQIKVLRLKIEWNWSTQSIDSKCALNWVWIICFLFFYVNQMRRERRHSSFMIWHSFVRWYIKLLWGLAVRVSEPFFLKFAYKKKCMYCLLPMIIIVKSTISEPKSLMLTTISNGFIKCEQVRFFFLLQSNWIAQNA